MIKQGDILKRKCGGEQKVLGVCGEVYLLSCANDFTSYWDGYTIKEIEKFFILPKEKWVPKDGEEYWIVEVTSTGPFANIRTWEKNLFDLARLASGNCYQTQAEAQARVDKILKVLSE